MGYFREAESNGVTVGDMWNVALLSLEEQLLNNSQPLPWKVCSTHTGPSFMERI